MQYYNMSVFVRSVILHFLQKGDGNARKGVLSGSNEKKSDEVNAEQFPLMEEETITSDNTIELYSNCTASADSYPLAD